MLNCPNVKEKKKFHKPMHTYTYIMIVERVFRTTN